MIIGEVEAVDRKQKIRDRYKGVDISELEVIPAKIIENLETSSVIRRVAAYIRVSTDNDEQTSSYELQKNYYTDYIQAQPGWVFVGIYADEGISGTSLEHRKGIDFLKLIVFRTLILYPASESIFPHSMMIVPFGSVQT